jgi:NAD(P)H-flavin reductase
LYPGQYLKLALEGVGEGYYAIASAPGPGDQYELLIKTGSRLGQALAALPPGAPVQLSGPLGQGFPLEKAKGRDLLLIATGSGLGAIRPLVLSVLGNRSSYGNVTLLVGVRTPASFAYSAELAQWEAAGIRVLRTVSQPGQSSWQGLTGYVQSHLDRLPVQNAAAFLVGQKEMVRSVTELLATRGLKSDRVFLNY